MTKLTYSVRLNRDGTLTVKVGRQREVITLVHKERGQVYDAVRWSLISKGVSMSHETLTQLLYDLLWSHLPSSPQS